jgi:hypothetical protein
VLSLGVLLACVIFSLIPAGALAIEPSGSIEGIVTVEGSAPTQQATVKVLRETAVDVYQTAGEVKTEPGGKYTVPALAPGSYKLEFLPGETGVAFQFYKEKIDLSTAETVTVGEAAITVDADLHAGVGLQGNVVEAAEVGGAKAPVGEAVVSLFAADARHELIAETIALGGSYELGGLPVGEYVVEVAPPPSLQASLAPRFYETGLSFATALTVKAEPASSPKQLNPIELEAAATITGTVTDAVTHQPLAGILVKATNAAEPAALTGSARTDANGVYSIIGLPAATYDLTYARYGEGGTPLDYAPAERAGVAPVVGQTIGALDVGLIPDVPTETAAPAVSGSPALGQGLSCSTGVWGGVAPISFSFQWLRDGGAIAGATGSSYTIQAVDEGHGLACEVSAGNSFAHVTARSGVVSVPPASAVVVPIVSPALTPSAHVSFSARRLTFRKGASSLRILCSTAPCVGTVELTEQVIVTRLRGRKVVSRKRQTLILALASFSLKPTASAKVTLHLTKVGRGWLAAYAGRSLPGLLLAAVRAGATSKQNVFFSAKPPAKRGK